MSKTNVDVNIKDLLEKINLEETDIFIVQDDQNTKRVSLRNFILSIIKDNELPTEYRIYSAYKIQSMIDTIDKYCTDGIGGVQGDIEDLEKFKATKEELEALKTELLKGINEKISIDEVNELLDSKMSATYKIKGSDMDTSSDDAKIKLENLAKEVIDAMTGATPIPTNRAPVGGWVTEDIADRAITGNKLAENYEFIAHITEGNINECIKAGLYLLGSEVLNLPKDGENDKAVRILKVERTADEYITQTVYYTDDMEYHPIYRRRGNVNRLHVIDFVRIDEITDTFKVTREMLADDFNTCEELSGVNIFTIKKEGNYIADETVTNLPTTGDKYLVEIRRYSDDNFIYHASKLSATKCELYECLTYRTAGYMLVNTEWFKVNTVSKSKFDGKTIHLFGDGILFGLGSSDIANKSIPALLTNEYGLRIINNTIGDATAGSYDDEILADRNILKQIEVATLSDADYVVVSVGTNDFKSGKANIGYNDSNDDKTFKGALNLAIKNIITKCPTAKIMFMTPIFRSRLNTGDKKNSDEYTVNDKYLSDFSDAMIEIAKLNHIPVLDMYSTFIVNKYNSEKFLSDGLHLNDDGQKMFAARIIDGLGIYY